VLTHDEALLGRLRLVADTTGSAQSPFEAWLTLRGLETLSLRVARQSETAERLARVLEAHPEVRSVRWPFLGSFPQAELARAQQRVGGGILCFELAGGSEAARALVTGTRIATLAENLGAGQTLLTHPATMTHGSLEPAERGSLGITDGLVRLSVGLEDPADLEADLVQALEQLPEPARSASREGVS
jgi:cystathionine beta-lyase/cystathionine gamma-synthase